MDKVGFFQGSEEYGPAAVPLFGPSDAYFEKTASATLLPEVSAFISRLKPQNDCQYVLVNAMGAGEYFGSNINGDRFSEAALIHSPDGWAGSPEHDKKLAKDWAYGFPTFYRAHVYAHHRNKDPNRALGFVELAAWNPHMRRVELITKLEKDRCLRFGGEGAWDKLKSGEYPDVSMGCVPAGTRVTLEDGSFRAMEQLQEADRVLTHKGRVRRVDQLHRYKYSGTIYKFKAFGFRRELCLTANHPLWLVRAEQLVCAPQSASLQPHARTLVPRQRHCTPLVSAVSSGCSTCSVTPTYAFEWVRADETNVGDYVAFAVPEEVDSSITSVDEAKLLGYYLSEGHVSNYNKRPMEQITFSLNITEKEIADEIEALGRRLGVTVAWHHEEPERGARSVTLVSKQLADRCLYFCGSGAKTKQLAAALLYAPVNLQLPFLGTYLNGDGGTYKGSAYFSTSSEQLAQQVFVVLARCGLIASINKIEHHPSERSVVKKDTTEYQVWVGTDFSYLLADFTRKPVRASKKVRGQRFFYTHDSVRYIMAPIEEIVEEDYDDDVFNISVEGDDSYLGELLATHNTKVPFDTCSITTDRKLYQQAWDTYQPGKDKSPGVAILEFHKKLKAKDGVGIRGLSITRHDYSDYARTQMNRILPDGRKVWVDNDFPAFFDISFVFIGADRIAKAMMKIADDGKMYCFLGSAELAEKLGATEDYGTEKTASVSPRKQAEMSKNVVPNQFANKAIPLLTAGEPELSRDLLDALSNAGMPAALSTLTGLGIVLRPSEFQRVMLQSQGQDSLADQFDTLGESFGQSDQRTPAALSTNDFSASLAQALLPMMAARSALGPFIEQRVLILVGSPEKTARAASSHSSELLRKIGAAYYGYRDSLMQFVPNAQDLIAAASTPSDVELRKVSAAKPSELFTPLSFNYLKYAFMSDVPVGDIGPGAVQLSGEKANASVQRVAPW